jgi:ribokinase
VNDVRIVVLGDVMLDVVTVLSDEPAHGSDTASRISLRPGGSAANVAAWLAAGGTATTYVGRVGDDETGRQAVEALRGVGVDLRVSIDPARPTGTCVVLVHPDGERTMFPEVGANAALSVRDVDEALADVPAFWHLHVSGYALLSGAQQAALHAVATARERGASTSVTCASAAPLRRVGAGTFVGLTRDIQVIFANAEEAELLTGHADPVAAAAGLTNTYPHAVVTCGSGGAVYRTPGFPHVHSPAHPVEAIDSTGAGDAFAAGFLAAWLSGSAPAAALSAGHQRAARAVTELGGRPSIG